MNTPSACTSLPYRLMPVSVNIHSCPDGVLFTVVMRCAPIEAIWVVSHISIRAVSEGALALSLIVGLPREPIIHIPSGATDTALQWYSPPVFLAISSLTATNFPDAMSR